MSEDHRRRFALLFLMVLLRDKEGACRAIHSLSREEKSAAPAKRG